MHGRSPHAFQELRHGALLLPYVPLRTVLRSRMRQGAAHYPGKVMGVRWYSITATADSTPTMSAPDPSTAQQREPAPVSGPNAPSPVANVPISPPTATAQNAIDPAVAPLVAMFPNFDPSVLEAVYLSNNKDQDAAIEALLGMSNPEVSHPECCAYVGLNRRLL
jgi:hypothetical protein